MRNSIGNFAKSIFNRSEFRRTTRLFFIKLSSFNQQFEGLGVIFQYVFNILNNFLVG